MLHHDITLSKAKSFPLYTVKKIKASPRAKCRGHIHISFTYRGLCKYQYILADIQ